MNTKLIAGLLMPVPVILILLAAGLCCMLLTRFRRVAIGLIAAATVMLLLVSTPFLPERLLSGLENAYSPIPENELPHADWIVVLGGGASGGEKRPPADRLGASSLYRIAEGVRLARSLPDAVLITSGGVFSRGSGSGELMAQTAASWGVDPHQIIVHDKPLNTQEEALAVSRRAKTGDSIILVTSAFHMPRAVLLFEKHGMQVIPAPAGRMVDPDRPEKHIGHQLPQSGYIEFAERALWEHLGMLWARIR